MASSQRSRRSRGSHQDGARDLGAVWREIGENFSREAVGLGIFALGGYLGFTLIALEEGAWIAGMTGWMAWPVILGLMLLGTVLMLGDRAGYWNPQAIVGAELLVLGLEAGAFIRDHAVADWRPPGVATPSGLIGWGLGNLLVGALGRWPAGLTVGVAIVIGTALLYRHTPLIYVTPYVRGILAFLGLSRAQGAAPDVDRSRSAATTAGRPPQPPIDPTTLSDVGPAGPGVPVPGTAPPPVPAGPPRPSSGAAPEKAKRSRPQARSRGGQIRLMRSPEELPPRDLLDEDGGRYGSRDAEAMAQLIEQTLLDFNIPVRVVNVESGPTVTQYGVEPLYVERGGQRRKVRVNRIVSLADDLALALAAPAVRIEAPVPGRPYVGIEVPNLDKTLVGMKSILASREMAQAGGALPMALGRDTSGAPVVADLTHAPHLLIAGATGSGKSVCINAIIVSLLMHHGPESLRFIMVDPKMVELPGYNGLPHIIGKAITDVEQVHGALTWLLLQMDDRYRLFRDHQVRNIRAYNALARRRKNLDPLPYTVLVVDELADLMITAPEEIERHLVRLAQMARATGIHLVLATQRPSTDVVTGLIKANFPTRIAFAVTSQVDSRVILDKPGAEKLLGQGDMLFLRPDSAKLLRVQGCYVSDREIERVVHFWMEQERRENPEGPTVRVAPWIGLLDRLEDEDELLQEAMEAVRGLATCSTSYVQRKLHIGYPRAARLMAQLEAQGVVGPDLGGGQGRTVLLKDEDGDDGEET